MVRASPMTAEERRQALVEATVPLLLEHGRTVTTRQIAEAAGVAEGTIFRVFESKHELVTDALVCAFDPSPLERQMALVPAGVPLREKLVAMAGLLQRRFVEIGDLMHAMGLVTPPLSREHTRAPRERITQQMVVLVEPHAEELRVPPAEVVHALRLLTFAASNRHIADGWLLTPDQIVATVLDGTRRRVEADR